MPNPSTGGKGKPKAGEHIHRIKPDSPDAVGGAVAVTAYAWGGKEVDPESPEALAKKSFDPATGLTRYWLKRATAGPDAGRLFNPQSAAFNAQAARRFHAETGRGQFEFRKASEESFGLYLKFLKTGNPINIRGAERC